MQEIQDYTTIGRQIIYVILFDIAALVLGIVQVPILTKALGSSQYGVWSLIITAVSLIVPFVQLSFSSSIVRFLAVEKDKAKIRDDFLSACSLVLMLGVIFSSLFFLLSRFLATFLLKDAALVSYMRLSSVLILLYAIFPVLLAFFRRARKIAIFNLFNLGLTALQVGLTILFISLGYRLTEVIAAAILSAATLTIIAMFIIFKEIGFSRPKFSNMKAYLKWGLPLTPNSAIQWIINESDTYIINYFLGVSAAGIYNAACAIGGYASFASMPVSIVLYPIVSKTYDEGNLDQCRNYLKYSFKYLMLFSIPAAVGLSMLAKPLLLKLTTPAFISGSVVVALAAFAALASVSYGVATLVFHLVGKTQIIIRLLSVATVLNIVLNIILDPHIGIIGGGLASLIAYIILAGFGLILARKYLKFDISFPFLIKVVLCSGFMALCIWLINPQSLLMIFLSILVGIISYFGTLILARGFSKTEFTFFTSFIKNSFKMNFKTKD